MEITIYFQTEFLMWLLVMKREHFQIRIENQILFMVTINFQFYNENH